MESFQKLAKAIEGCSACPRLRKHCQTVAQTRKREFRDWDYWGKPVPGFGDPRARLWIVGLAPAAHGANRTGRMFTGDSSGRWLYKALYETGFSTQPTSENRQDQLQLKQVYISAAARCAPPENKPTPQELTRCSEFLDREFKLLRERQLILALGAIAFEAILKLLERQGAPLKPKPRFGHGSFFQFGKEKVLCSYHPSRQNTQTGRLTETMWRAVFEEAGRWVNGP